MCAGIGNVAGRNAVNAARTDGMNMLGDKDSTTVRLKPYYDYTGYTSVNTATNITDPTRWQPASLERGANHLGAFVSQQFITPQLGEVKPFAFKRDINEVIIAPSGRSDKVSIICYSSRLKAGLAVCIYIYIYIYIYISLFLHIQG